MATKEEVMKILEGVNDPELGIDIVTLELVFLQLSLGLVEGLPEYSLPGLLLK
jgi:hypothetical protein|tara:strand:- start:1203 stop:1361 length:159 start_codon:yes stop_codon:yes gene_type:complete